MKSFLLINIRSLKVRRIGLILSILLPAFTGRCADPTIEWHQGAGPTGNFSSPHSAPLDWSVVQDRNIRWRLKLPETGQSIPVVSLGRVYFTTYASVSKDSSLGKDIVAWCCAARTGRILWQRTIEGKHPLRLSGCFGDSSSPPAVCVDGRVVFVIASGGIVCFDLKGREIWNRNLLSVGRSLPFEMDGNFVFTRQQYPPDPDGTFPHKYADLPQDEWTQLQALVGINDLGTVGESWTRASLSFSAGRIYAHTIKELICIEKRSNPKIGLSSFPLLKY